MDSTAFLFYLLAGITCACALAVVVSQNIVRAAAWLLFTLAGTGGVFFLLGAEFVGATQLLVYVGGTLVLVVFGVMLTAQGPFISMKIGVAEWAIAAVVGGLLYAVLAVCLWPIQPPGPAMTHEGASMDKVSSNVLGQALLGIDRATPMAELSGVKDPMRPIERRPMSYLLPFEIVSVHLLVVLIGAAYLARAKRRRGATP